MNEEESINKKIEDLKQQKEELWLKEGKAYMCKQCGNIVMKLTTVTRDQQKGLCYGCLRKEVKETKRKELMQTFKDAKIVDIEPDSNPLFNPYDVETITLEVITKQYDVERYVIKVSGYDDHYMEIEKDTNATRK